MHPESSLDLENQLILITQQLLTESGEAQNKAITLQSSLQRHLGVDSLMRAELFQRIEKKFNLSFPDRLIAEAETLFDIANFIQTAQPTVHKKLNKEAQPLNLNSSNVDPSQAQSLIDVLTLYATESPDRKHILFQNEEGGEDILTYKELFDRASEVAFALQQQGLETGDTVAIMLPTELGFFYAFFGILLAGGIPVPIYPPFRAHAIEAYAKQEARILRSAEVRILITFQQAEKLSHLLRAFVPSLKVVTTLNELAKVKGKPALFTANENDKAFIQYTSGSTNTPKGVLLTHYNLLSNIRAYGHAIQVKPTDVAVSWLPLYHDMGLIGAWLGSLYFGVPLVLMTPFSFLNKPERWLWAIHRHRGTISAGPNFAYELCVKKIDHSVIEGLDLSSWRLAANGAEAVYPKTLDRFAKKFSAYGLKREALTPVYGLAESTVALAIPPMGRGPRIDYIDRHAFENQKKAQPISAEDNNALAYPACGHAIMGHEIRIVDENGQLLPDRHIGQLQFRGPSSLQGYYNNPEATQAIIHDGWVDSGDHAYQAEGDLFITGRKKDVIIKAGRNLYPAEIEELVGTINGVRQGCVVAFGTLDANRGTEQLVVVAETKEKETTKRDALIKTINEAIATSLDITPDHIVLVPQHTIPKTSSGKLQRSACKIAYENGKLSSRSSPLVQMAKLATQWLGVKIKHWLGLTSRFIYTLYVWLLLGITLPIMWIIVQLVSQSTAVKLSRLWAGLICHAAFCPVTVIHKQNLYQESSMVFAANHASYIDTLFLMHLLPVNVRFVGKKELTTTPMLRTFMQKLDYLPIDRSDLTKGLEDTKNIENALKKGASIAIFPEGTFGYAVGLRPFKLGAFKLSAETATPICPIALQGTREILRSGEFLLKPRRVIIHVSEPIYPQGTDWQEITRLKNSVRAEIAQHCGEPVLDLIAPVSFIAAPKPEDTES